MDEGALYELAESIKSQGIMQPILVRKIANGGYEIIAGERRFRAAKLAGLTQVPVLVREQLLMRDLFRTRACRG
jgi:ParB family chromosome partitioning protein